MRRTKRVEPDLSQNIWYRRHQTMTKTEKIILKCTMLWFYSWLIIVFWLVLWGINNVQFREKGDTQLHVTSSSFKHGQMLPSRYTCEGERISPEISWNGAPDWTQSFMVIATDRDIPTPEFPLFNTAHWIVYNIPKEVTSLSEGISNSQFLKDTGEQTSPMLEEVHYNPPCPSFGTHRYHFVVYALDTILELEPKNASQVDLLIAIENHAIAVGGLLGGYKKQT